jgi:hypothetical protein
VDVRTNAGSIGGTVYGCELKDLESPKLEVRKGRNRSCKGTWILPAAFASLSMAKAKAVFQRGTKAIANFKVNKACFTKIGLR